METKLFNSQGEEIGKVRLSTSIFEHEINEGLLWENISVILKNQRLGLAKTKTRAEVQGGGKKPWRQKGVGWARHGSIRSPIWRKGGVVFGPKPRDYSTRFPQRKKLAALLSSLSAKAKEDGILVIEDLQIEAPKTRMLASILTKLKLSDKRVLIGVDEIDRNLKLASQNISNISLKRTSDINCYDVLLADSILFTQKGLIRLEQRCTTKR